MLKPNTIIIWTGTNASIPAGFSRETSLDSRHPKGTANATNPNVTGGNANHQHTSPSHTHDIAAHTHTYTLGNTNSNPTGSGSGSGALDGNHNHSGTSGAASAGTTVGTALTYADYSSEPPSIDVIFIKATGSSLIPDDGVLFWASTSTPATGYQFCDGTNGSTDLRNKHLRGAGTGANAGGTGGALTNTHTIAHTHTANGHTHTGANSGGPYNNGQCQNNSNGAYNLMSPSHVHFVNLTSGTQALNSYGGSIGQQAESNIEPAYTKLNPIQNISGSSAPLKVGMVAMWLGTLASIPSGWLICDGTNGTPDMRDRHLKASNSLSEHATTGGSNTHTHASQTHSHTGSSTHTHGGGGLGHYGEARQDGGGAGPQPYTVVHQSISPTTPTTDYGNANTTADSVNNEPPYLTTAYIMATQGALASSSSMFFAQY
jgi:hypothetical protein